MTDDNSIVKTRTYTGIILTFLSVFNFQYSNLISMVKKEKIITEFVDLLIYTIITIELNDLFTCT